MTLALTQPAINAVLSGLDAEQRAAAVLGEGHAQIIAPAGSGKTTTLVARLGVLLTRGVAPERICVVTFNRDSAHELSRRISARLGEVAAHAARIEVRTLHALARQVVMDAGGPTDVVADRLPLLRAARRGVLVGRNPAAPALPEVDELDTQLSAWRVEGREPSAAARPVLDAYAARMAARGALDFDDLVARASVLLETDPRIRLRWQAHFSPVGDDEQP